jgi:hypothetical protein
MKFRVIQSNNRGLVTQEGDRTYASRGPAKGEEELELATLFIWVKGKDRHLARCWTRWTDERLGDDFIYVVSKFRDLIDLYGETRYHQWCSKQLRLDMWTLQRPQLDLKDLSCPSHETVHETDRHKSALYLQRRKKRLHEQTPVLTELEQQQIRQIYEERDRLNQAAGFIRYHVDHVAPLARGGQHHPSNLQVINASDNVRKGARVTLSTSPQKPDMVHS